MENTSYFWPHAPLHRLGERGVYFVTTATHQKLHHFAGHLRLGVLCRGLLKLAEEYGWQLEAWAVFSNHYHFVAHSPENSASNVSRMLGRLHEVTAKWVNKLDRQPGRKVWHNFRDTRLTIHPSYLARLNYVHQNAVHHRLVAKANQYPYCSAGWFERTAESSQIRTIYGLKIDRLSIPDDFEPLSPDF